MPRINRITNLNKLVEKKINYFLDRLNHSVTYTGWEWNLEMESPTALTEKILFRLREDIEIRLIYFDNYFQNTFFMTDKLWDHYKTFKAVKAVVMDYNSKTNLQQKKDLINPPAFKHNLELLHQDLLAKMPHDLIEGILSITVCRHDLNDLVEGSTENHATYYKFYTLTLVSEYLYRGCFLVNPACCNIKRFISNDRNVK